MSGAAAIRLVGLIVLAALLAGCEQHAPTAYTEEEAAADRQPLRQSKPITAIVRDLGLMPPDADQPTLLLRQLVVELRKADPKGRYEGVTFKLSENNALDRDWIVQTPNWWGRRAADLPAWQLDCPDCLAEISLPECRSDSDCGTGHCRPLRLLEVVPDQAGKRVCVGHSDMEIERLYKTIASTRYHLDVTTLQWPPDGRYLAALRRGLLYLARSGNAITVRILVGQYPPLETDALALLRDLTRGMQQVPHSRLSIHVAAMRSCLDPTTCGNFSWNHAKMVLVDGRTAIVGGHNMWSRDYLLDRPIHDLSLELHGSAAADAIGFADALWDFVCANDADKRRPIEVRSLLPGDKEIGTRCPTRRLSLRRDQFRRPGNVAVLAIGRLGAGITEDFANHSDLARDLMLGAAKHSIRIVQQDFGFGFGQLETNYPESSMERIVDFVLSDRGDVQIVLSNFRARGKTGATYSNRLTLETTAAKFREVARRRSTLPDAQLDQLLCRRLAIAPHRFGPDDTWPDNAPIGNHAKFWMIDDRAFYIGSDNFYPVDLQEFGFIVESRQAVADVHRDYWGPLWKWSSPHAVSGPTAARCTFSAPPTAPASRR